MLEGFTGALFVIAGCGPEKAEKLEQSPELKEFKTCLKLWRKKNVWITVSLFVNSDTEAEDAFKSVLNGSNKDETVMYSLRCFPCFKYICACLHQLLLKWP